MKNTFFVAKQNAGIQIFFVRYRFLFIVLKHYDNFLINMHLYIEHIFIFNNNFTRNHI